MTQPPDSVSPQETVRSAMLAWSVGAIQQLSGGRATRAAWWRPNIYKTLGTYFDQIAYTQIKPSVLLRLNELTKHCTTTMFRTYQKYMS